MAALAQPAAAPASRLTGKTIVAFADFQFEDMELMFPKIRLEEEGARVLVVGGHPTTMKYTGKHGYPIKSDMTLDELEPMLPEVDGLLIPGGFAPDYMRRNARMLAIVVDFITRGVPVAAICHAPWMFCSARTADGRPVVAGKRATGFVAVKDDLINAGAEWVDEAVVVDGAMITSRTPADLVPFCHAIIAAVEARA